MKKNVSDNLLFLLAAVAILGFSSIPFWLGKSAETDALAFRGTYTDTADYAVHLAMMQAGRLGEWAYQLRFTSEDHNPASIRLFYIWLGHASRLFNLDVETVFHAARWLFGLTALFVLDRLFHKTFPQKAHARFAFFLAVLGGGAGWLQLMLGAPLEPISPIDFWLIDAYILFSISLFPSFSFTLTLMAGALYFFFQFLEDGRRRNIAWVSLLAAASQLVNPIAFAVVDLSMAGAVLFTWWKHKKMDVRQGYALFFIAIVQIPLLFYNFWVLAGDPVWSQFTRQNETLSPPPVFYLWGFAPFWLFAIVGIIRSFRERKPIMGAMSIWVMGGFLLAYLPVLIQRRFLLGVTIPLGILAMYGFQFVMAKLPPALQALKKREGLLGFAYVLFASVSSLFLILNSSLYVLTQPKSLFYPRAIDAAAQWLDENAAPGDFVLADAATSQIIAQQTGLRVYIGHEMETLHFEEKQREVQLFFEGKAPKEWLAATQAHWVLADKDDTPITDGLEIMYENAGIIVFKVKGQ